MPHKTPLSIEYSNFCVFHPILFWCVNYVQHVHVKEVKL